MTRRDAMVAELATLPEHLVGELIGGALVVQPRPRPALSALALRLKDQLAGPERRAGGGGADWKLLAYPELYLGPPATCDIVVPDLAGWRSDRWAELPSGASIHVAPDFVVEILAPSTARLDRGAKRDLYARQRVAHLWLIDVEAQAIELFQRVAEQWLLVRTMLAPAVARVAPFETEELDLEQLFAC